MLRITVYGHERGSLILAHDYQGTRWIKGHDGKNEVVLHLEPEQIEQIGAKLDEWREQIRCERVAKEGPSNGFQGATISGDTMARLAEAEEGGDDGEEAPRS